ncbi:MAG: hypothetical protein ABIK86_06740 [candidate division WOR-3 bacterium]
MVHFQQMPSFWWPYYKQNDIPVPAVPESLRLVYLEDDNQPVPNWIVTLEWNPNYEADLAGYHLYRSYEDGPFVRITAEPVPANTYTDIVGSGVWGYYVTAVDLAGLESGPSNFVYFTSPGTDFGIGESMPSPYLERRAGYASWAPGSAHDADLGERLSYLKNGLDPREAYTMAAVFCQPPGRAPIRVELRVDDTLVVSGYQLPSSPRMFVFRLPPKLYQDGAVRIEVDGNSGMAAALAEVYMWQGRIKLGGPQSSEPTRRPDPGSVTVCPNPARSQVHIRVSPDPRNWRQVEIVDVQGRAVRTLACNGTELTWNGKDARDRSVPAGAYFIRATADDTRGACRALLVR